MNYLLLMANEVANTAAAADVNKAAEFCEKLTPVWTVFGYIIFAVKVIVPLLLIITGMITLAKAVMEKKEDDIKKAQSLLVKKVIYGVAVFLVIQVVSVIIDIVGGDNVSWKGCADCALHPFRNSSKCSLTIKDDPSLNTDKWDGNTVQ